MIGYRPNTPSPRRLVTRRPVAFVVLFKPCGLRRRETQRCDLSVSLDRVDTRGRQSLRSAGHPGGPAATFWRHHMAPRTRPAGEIWMVLTDLKLLLRLLAIQDIGIRELARLTGQGS